MPGTGTEGPVIANRKRRRKAAAITVLLIGALCAYGLLYGILMLAAHGGTLKSVGAARYAVVGDPKSVFGSDLVVLLLLLYAIVTWVLPPAGPSRPPRSDFRICAGLALAFSLTGMVVALGQTAYEWTQVFEVLAEAEESRQRLTPHPTVEGMFGDSMREAAETSRFMFRERAERYIDAALLVGGAAKFAAFSFAVSLIALRREVRRRRPRKDRRAVPDFSRNRD